MPGPAAAAPAAAEPLAGPASGAADPQLCWSVLVALHLVLGLGVSTLAVWVLQQRSRAAFLAEAMEAARPLEGASSSSEEDAGSTGPDPPPRWSLAELEGAGRALGLRGGEALDWALCDPLPAALTGLGLLPTAGALAWLGMLTAVQRWAPASC